MKIKFNSHWSRCALTGTVDNFVCLDERIIDFIFEKKTTTHLTTRLYRMVSCGTRLAYIDVIIVITCDVLDDIIGRYCSKDILGSVTP